MIDDIKSRLQTAEAHAKQALAKSDPDHPLAGPTKELLAVHTEIRELLQDSYDSSGEGSSSESPEVSRAAIELEREEHTAKPEFMDVVKALFMWKDHPDTKLKDDSQTGL